MNEVDKATVELTVEELRALVDLLHKAGCGTRIDNNGAREVGPMELRTVYEKVYDAYDSVEPFSVL